jgi:hypothetical protein
LPPGSLRWRLPGWFTSCSCSPTRSIDLILIEPS